MRNIVRFLWGNYPASGFYMPAKAWNQEWEIFQTKFVEKIKTFYVQKRSSANRAVYDIV